MTETATLVDVARAAAGYVHDPLGYVYWAYPWGSEALPYDGPDAWQRTVLADLGAALSAAGGAPQVVQIAIAGANGVGKSALAAHLIDWALSTWEMTRGRVTANTATQLRVNTWAELARWHAMGITRGMFDLQATSLVCQERPLEWRIDAVPWSMERPEAFAGLHNSRRRILLLIDEAAGVPDLIWEYVDACTTDADTEIICVVKGNTTRNTGRFRECWRKFERRWRKPSGPGIRDGRVDGRESRHTNKRKIAEWLEDYGEDHDFVRVRVKAEFPRVGDMQFFASDAIAAARTRDIPNEHLRLMQGTVSVDVATTGADATVIGCVRGPKLMWLRRYPYTEDTMEIVGLVVDAVRQERNLRAITVDANGVGKGVADRLSQLSASPQGQGLPPVVHVYGAMAASDPIQYRNLRGELYDRCRRWLKTASLPDDPLLVEEMEGIGHGFSGSMQLAIETKKDMKDRLGRSPDALDMLIYSFADVVYTGANLSGRHAAKPLIKRRWT